MQNIKRKVVIYDEQSEMYYPCVENPINGKCNLVLWDWPLFPEHVANIDNVIGLKKEHESLRRKQKQ